MTFPYGVKPLFYSAPFKYAVIDDWWDPFLIWALHEEISLFNNDAWHQRDVFAGEKRVEKKYSLTFERCAATRVVSEIQGRLSSPGFISWLETEIGISGLQFDTIGGGVHRIVPGGLLGKHIDFNVDERGNWRRVNVLLYLNACGDNGALTLFGSSSLKPELGPGWADELVFIQPRPNRMVIFECSETSWHGHPEPLGDGPDRLSIAAYYFTKEKPKGAAAPHSTVWHE